MARHSRAILGPLVRHIQDMYLADIYKGREAFSKIKGIIRKAGARTREALLEAIEQALKAITPVDVAGWFAHSGYEVEVQYL